MPFTFNGIGTMYYGKRDKGPDGSYATTEWIVFVYVPVLPLRSFRVLPVEGGANYGLYNSQQYLVQRTPLNWRQVGNVYLTMVGIVAAFAAVLAAAAYFGD